MAAIAALSTIISDAGAASVPSKPLPVAPPVIRVAPPPPPVPQRIAASGIAGGKLVDLYVNGGRAIVIQWPSAARSGPPTYFTIESLGTVLALLADRDYAFLWDELTAWAGTDLGLFRARLRDQAAAISSQAMSPPPLTSAESVTSRRLADFIRLSAIYLQIGEPQLAEQVMRTYVGFARPKGRSDQQTADWVMANARLASVMQMTGKVEQSYRLYEDIQARAGRSEHAMNGMVNHAAVLAEHGRQAEALRLIDAAWARFRKEAGDDALAGSERQFAWIRACALEGLGRAAEADAAYEVVRRSGPVVDSHFIVSSKESIAWRGLWCRKREDLLKSMFLELLKGDLPTHAALALQPAYKPDREDPALLARLRADPDIQAAAAKRIRVLPAAMIPALNKYR